LLEERELREQDDVALVRIEQVYPFDEKALTAQLKRYKNLQDILWCQEEPLNQGVWFNGQHHIRKAIHASKSPLYLRYVGRPARAAPAGGYMSMHLEEQKKFVNEALDLNY